MEVLSQKIFMTFLDDQTSIVRSDNPGLPLSCSNGHAVNSYIELLKKLAALSYLNATFRLLFRGQLKDYKLNTRGEISPYHSCLYPSILRPEAGQDRVELLDKRFDALNRAETLLKEKLPIADLHKNQMVRWAILQHYEVCRTPLLDLTQSIQTALSFAIGHGHDEGYLFVLAFPQLTGAVSVSIESMTQIIDLNQICPSEALRPHFQSGILASDYPVIDRREASHGKRGMIGNNFACRLLAKFRLKNVQGWTTEGFTPTPNNILFPDKEDEWYSTLNEIKHEVNF